MDTAKYITDFALCKEKNQLLTADFLATLLR